MWGFCFMKEKVSSISKISSTIQTGTMSQALTGLMSPISLKRGMRGSYSTAISVILFALTGIFLSVNIFSGLFSADRIISGVYINNIHVGTHTISEASLLLNDKYTDNLDEITYTLICGAESTAFTLTDIEYKYDINKAVDKAASVGKKGNIIKRISTFFKVRKNYLHLPLEYSYNSELLEEIINGLYTKVYSPVKQADIIVHDYDLIVRSGAAGTYFDKSSALKSIMDILTDPKSTEINIELHRTHPSPIDADSVYNALYLPPLNARYVVEDNAVSVTEHVPGRNVERLLLAAFLGEALSAQNSESVLKLSAIEPEHTKEELESVLFRDVLGTMASSFSTDTQINKNRAVNISLATDKIAGLILAPGDKFSFNNVVGPRTKQAGYLSAFVYLAGKVVEDTGGGICQVSSTLYNAVLKSDLKIVTRWNHYYTVSYVPLGTDATVSYNSVDFVFENSTEWPVKIDAVISEDNKLEFTITGTRQDYERVIEIVPEVIKEIDFAIRYVDDETLEPGKTKLVQEGKKGYVVNTYRIVKVNDAIIEKKLLHVNYYNTLDQEVRRGV